MSSPFSDHAHLRSEPSIEGLEKVARALGRGYKVVGSKRFGGGLVGATSCVNLSTPQGDLHVVLKRFPAGSAEPQTEFDRLGFAWTLDIPTPEPLAIDNECDWFGGPAIVMSCLPGSPSPGSIGVDDWASLVSGALVALPSADISQAEGVLPRPSAAEVWGVVQDASGWGEVYRRAAEVVGSTLAARKDFDRVVGHGDFHPGNLLFDEGRLSGVVDWSHAWIGPRDFDLSYCRTEVALVAGVEVAERLRDAYERELGAKADDVALWDLACALHARKWSHIWYRDYLERGRDGVTLRHLRSRLQAFTKRALAEIG
ncbi:MAG: phosphotransferase family protein [Microthrixaceae bacterium]